MHARVSFNGQRKRKKKGNREFIISSKTRLKINGSTGVDNEIKLTSANELRKVRGVKPRFNYDRPSAAGIVIGKILKIIS